jgi:hypothetical protein
MWAGEACTHSVACSKSTMIRTIRAMTSNNTKIRAMTRNNTMMKAMTRNSTMMRTIRAITSKSTFMRTIRAMTMRTKTAMKTSMARE